MLIEIYPFSVKKTHFKISFEKWRPFWLGLNMSISLNVDDILVITLQSLYRFSISVLCSYVSGLGQKYTGRNTTEQWRHNGSDGVPNHQPHNGLLNRLFRIRSKKTSKLRVTCRWSVNSPHKWPVTRKMFPFDDVIMNKNIMWSIMDTYETYVCAYFPMHVWKNSFVEGTVNALMYEEFANIKKYLTWKEIIYVRSWIWPKVQQTTDWTHDFTQSFIITEFEISAALEAWINSSINYYTYNAVKNHCPMSPLQTS